MKTERTSRTCYRIQREKDFHKRIKNLNSVDFLGNNLKARRWLHNSYEKMIYNLDYYASTIHEDIQFTNYLSVSIFSKNIFSTYPLSEVTDVCRNQQTPP